MFEFAGKKILVTGGAGFLGNSVVKELAKEGVNQTDIAVPRSREFDLREKNNCLLLTRDVDLVLHLAGNVGGIGKNQRLPGTLFYDNAIMGIELMEAERKNQMKKFVCLGTICAYPKYTPVPFREEDLWIGYPEETNASYGLAKKMLLVQAQAYRQQYGFNVIYLLPVNMYGPFDTFDPKKSHVIAALIKKIYEAKKENKDYIEVWGTGRATREFLYVEDGAEGIILAAEKYDKPDPVNLGSGMEISIKDLVKLICELTGYKGKLIWDKT